MRLTHGYCEHLVWKFQLENWCGKFWDVIKSGKLFLYLNIQITYYDFDIKVQSVQLYFKSWPFCHCETHTHVVCKLLKMSHFTLSYVYIEINSRLKIFAKNWRKKANKLSSVYMWRQLYLWTLIFCFIKSKKNRLIYLLSCIWKIFLCFDCDVIVRLSLSMFMYNWHK